MIRCDCEQFQHFWLPLVIVGGLVVLTAWIGQVADHSIVVQAVKPGHDPDYFVDGLKAVAYDDAGVPRYHLTAVRLQHYMDDDTTTLESPLFVRDGPDVARVEAVAKRGKVSPDGKIVYLYDDVNMHQQARAGGLPIEMRTDYLKVLTDEDRMSSNRPVVVTQGGSRLSGNAMQADGKARTFRMEGRVKGIYEIAR